MELCNWIDSSTIRIQNFISTPFDFYNFKVANNYSNIISSLKKSDNNFKLNLFNDPLTNNDELISAHKYLINTGCYDNIYQLGGIPQMFIQGCVVGGRTMTANNEKIIKNVAKEIVIDKEK